MQKRRIERWTLIVWLLLLSLLLVGCAEKSLHVKTPEVVVREDRVLVIKDSSKGKEVFLAYTDDEKLVESSLECGKKFICQIQYLSKVWKVERVRK